MLNLMWKCAKPLLFRLDAEKAHRLTLKSLNTFPKSSSSVLTLLNAKSVLTPINLCGLTLRNPVGLAAGLDKDGEAIGAWPAMGFGFIELGTVTAHPQAGNPKPRLFRLKKEHGIINRMGFNNHGSQALAEKLRHLKERDKWPKVPVGANVGKSKITPLEQAPEDYCTSLRRLRGLADYFTVNVSSPNTPGLRDLQSAENLKRLIGPTLKEAQGTAMFVKFAPDMHPDSLRESVELCIDMGCSGIIATNTTNSRPGNTGRLNETGGLSGRPLHALSTSQIAIVLDTVNKRAPVIGVGGVSSAEDARTFMDMGCSAVQLYSALIFQGPSLIPRIVNGLAQQR